MRLRWLTMSIVLAWTGLAHAEFITVLGQAYLIRGEATYLGCADPDLPCDPPFTKSFHEASALPPLSDFVLAFGFAGQALAEASVDGRVTPATARISAEARNGDEGLGTGSASAFASITFAPLVERILVTSDELTEGGTLVLEILDLTTGLPVYFRTNPPLPEPESVVVPLDRAHIYAMAVVADSPFSNISLRGDLSIAPVPELSTLVLLLGGLVGVGLLTRVAAENWVAYARRGGWPAPR